MFVTSSPGRVRSIAMSVSVCLSVSSHISKTAHPNFAKFSVHVKLAVVRSSDDMYFWFLDDVIGRTKSDANRRILKVIHKG